MKHFYLTLLPVVLATALSAQCYLPQSLQARLLESDVIAIGKVADSEAVYNERGEIYTIHKLAVDRFFSALPFGEVPDTLVFYTMGGQIGDEQTIVYPSLRGISDASGMFLLRQYKGNRISVAGRTLFRPTAVHESLVGYDEENGTFSDGFTNLGRIDEVEKMITTLVGRLPVRITNAEYRGAPGVRPKSLMPSISSLAPLAVSAGIGDEITITGSGFGTTRGEIFFDSPDDGPGGSFTGASDNDILSWSDTEVRVRVISEAGGGAVLLRTADGTQTASTQVIDIDFAVTNLELSSGEIVTPRLIDDGADGDGGYAFAVSNNAANNGRSLAGDAPALAALNRAIATWQEDGDFNIRLSGTTSLQVPDRDDDVNIVAYGSDAYDFDTELGTGTVGIAFSYYNSCGSSEFELTGADVLFRRPGRPNGVGGGSVTYDFGDGNGGTDFESVALHEFGHVHQLKHVADPNEVMSYRISSGITQRSISADTKAGADFVANLALTYSPPVINCGGDFNQERQYETYSQAVLPVEWLSFTATSQPKAVALNWQTASETDNEFFAVERSTDGASFTEIGRVSSSAPDGTGAAYGFLDATPHTGTSYYRIRQVDFGGAYSFSVLRRVDRTAGAAFRVYPNPVTDVLVVNDPGASLGREYRIFDAMGRQVRRLAGTGIQTRIAVNDLPEGQYVLRTSDGTAVRFVR